MGDYTIQHHPNGEGLDDVTTEVISSIESTIDSNGLYIAGDTAGSDTVTVTDNCNMNISDSAYVNVLTPTTITTTIAP